jgi:hypothetical protein
MVIRLSASLPFYKYDVNVGSKMQSAAVAEKCTRRPQRIVGRIRIEKTTKKFLEKVITPSDTFCAKVAGL